MKSSSEINIKNYYKPSQGIINFYSGAPIDRGFYDRNLNKAHKLYVKKGQWQPPKPKKIKKITHPKTFREKLDNYLKDYQIIKQKFDLQEKEKNTEINNSEKMDIETQLEKIKIINNNIFMKEMDKYSDCNFFNVTDDIINSLEEEGKNLKENNNKSNDISFLKTMQNLKDYDARLFSNEKNDKGMEELMVKEADDEEQEKNYSDNLSNNEAKIDENNDEQIDEKKEEQILDSIANNNDNDADKNLDNIDKEFLENNDEELEINNIENKINDNYDYNNCNDEGDGYGDKLKKINNNNIIINDNESNNKDKTFNHLKKLQKLIKKESALKEICK